MYICFLILHNNFLIKLLFMGSKFTILFDLDGTLVDTAPDLMRAHNHVMKKFGYPTKSTEEIRNLVGQGAGAMLGRSIWGQS